MAWTFVLTDLTGTQIGAVDRAYERGLSLSLNSTPNASFRVRLDNPVASEITSRKGDVLLKVYQGSTLRFIGDCISAEEVGQEGGATLACNFAGPLWRLSKRLCGTDATNEGVTYTARPRGGILADTTGALVPAGLLNAANTTRDTGIRVGTIASLYASNAGPWTFKPIAEAFTEMAASYAPPPFETIGSPYQAQDGFSDPPGTVFLNGRTADGTGGTWDDSGHGAATGFIVDGGGDNLARTTTADSAGGRYAFLGPSLTNCVVQCFIDRDGTMGAPATSQGIAARGTDEDNVLVLYVWEDVFPGHQQFALVKYVGGVRTIIWTSNFGNIIYTGMGGGYLRLTVDDTGRWGAWWWPAADTSYQAVPIQTGIDSDLATGGALASGKCGIHDGNGTATACNRVYDSFVADVPVSTALDSQALDFELVPSEPTVDGSGVQIATLNVSSRIGTDKPNVIFEYGGGNRSLRSYKRVISRDALMTKAYVLPTDSDALIAPENAAAIAARGLYEDVVPTDAGAAAAAVADLQLYFRKQAREVITFEPSASAPAFGTDYIVGDTVTGRAIVNGTVRFNGTFRVYGVDISIDDEGKETVVPVLTLT